MQTVEQPPAGPGATPPDPFGVRPSAAEAAEPELQLLLNWARDPDEASRLRSAIIGTIVVHLVIILSLAIMPQQDAYRPRVASRPLLVTKIFDPPIELTQKAPNKGKVTKELAVQSPTPSVPIPTPAPGAQSRKFTPPVPSPEKKPVAAPAVVEPPKIEQAQSYSPQLQLPQLPPQVQPQERPAGDTKPKLTFENPSAAPSGPSGPPRIPTPGGTVQEAVRELSRSANKGVSGSDTFDLGNGRGLNMPPSPGRPRMDYELKTDPQGVDFRPYVLQVLAVVRRNWFAVYPESAKLGTRGQVKLEFAIAKDGKVTKVAFSSQSGTQALDHAAVAAISASNPLPALPAEFRGDRIVLAFTFSYNLGR
jgi:TonB family protein